MPGKLVEPKVITDFNNKPVCILPTGFYFDDQRWDKIWQRYDEKGESLTLEDLHQLFPEEPTVQVPELVRSGEMNFKNKDSEES